jgi:hypothetical protein
MDLEQIASAAAKLTEEERGALASRLLHGLETPVYVISDDEVLQRMQEAATDPAALLTFAELVAGLKLRVG